MTTIETFKKMLDWLYANTEANNQTDVARKAGINQVTMSRIINGKVKGVKPETLRAVNAAYGNVFNPEWMRGESDVMLVADLSANGEATVPAGFPSSNFVNLSGMTNVLLSAKDETIAALRSQLDEKERMIVSKEEIIACKDELIATLQKQVCDLRSKRGMKKGISAGRSPSESVDRKITHGQ